MYSTQIVYISLACWHETAYGVKPVHHAVYTIRHSSRMLFCSAEVEMKDGYRAPCAVKRMPYHTQLEQEVADAELEALLATHDLQGVVTCRALFEHLDQDGRRYLHLATE